jgi:hypothetical protein
MTLINVNSSKLFFFGDHKPMTPEKLAFVERLEEVVRLLEYPKHGRQTQIAVRYKIKQPSVKQWFDGRAMPSYEIALDLCRRAMVGYEWLMSGRGEKYIAPRVEELQPETRHAALLMENMDKVERMRALNVLSALQKQEQNGTTGSRSQ